MEPTDADIEPSLEIQVTGHFRCPPDLPGSLLGLQFASAQRQFAPVDFCGLGFQRATCPADHGVCLDAGDSLLAGFKRAR